MSSQATLFDFIEDGKDQLLKEKNGVQHLKLACRSILNYCDTWRMPDTYTINPYRGCEFGCAYCYARYTHEFMELEWDQFERRIFVKQDAPRVLLKTLDCGRLRGKHIAMGTATDPYQPAEARFRITRGLLEVFAQVSGLSISITTKSSLVRRDLDVLKEISKRNEIRVNLSLISLDEDLIRRLEPKASRPQARLAAVQELVQGGLRAGIFIMPILPGITDSPQNLEAVIAAAREADASFVSASVLFLRHSARESYYGYLRRYQPDLFKQYRALFKSRAYTPRAYQCRMRLRVARIKEKYGY